MLLMLWPPYRRRVRAEADEYLESFGERAAAECLRDRGIAEFNEDFKRSRFLSAVWELLMAKCDRDHGLDDAAQSAELQELFDHGPGYVVHRPKDTTLH